MPRDRPPRIWEKLRRALAGAEPRPEPLPAPTAPVPASAKPPAVSLQGESFVPSPPFLLDSDGDDSPASAVVTEPPRASPPADPPPTPAASVAARAPVEPAAEAPRLARGLASFSRSNADREKKFAHLLHDDEPDGEKKPPA